MKTICIFQECIPDYRVPFFNTLHSALEEEGMGLTVIAGAPPFGQGYTDSLEEAGCATRVRNLRFGKHAYWQCQVWRHVRECDLVILPQANGFLNIYPILLRRKLIGRPKVAFWGHGANLNETRPQPVRDAWKRFLTTEVDWWFAYTEISAAIVRQAEFPADRITVVNNSIDTESLRAERAKLTDDDLLATRRKLFPQDFANDSALKGMPAWKTGVFCGRLVPLKWIPFLLRSIDLIHQQLPEFRMIIVGDGPERDHVRAFCTRNSWCAWVGAKRGPERTKCLALADVWMNPAAVGLSILDAITLSIPMTTTKHHLHGPEIFYLRNGENGIMTEPDECKYAHAVTTLIQADDGLAAMKHAAAPDSRKYSLEGMVSRFRSGVMQCMSRD